MGNSFKDEKISANLMKSFADHFGLSEILVNQIKFGSLAESAHKFLYLKEYLNILEKIKEFFMNNSSNNHLTMEQRVEFSNLPKERFYLIPWFGLCGLEPPVLGSLKFRNCHSEIGEIS